MRFIADFHIHSKYSRATSKDMVLEEIDRVADEKGILVMGTGDFTHFQWLNEIREKLEPAEPGLFQLKKIYKRPTIKGNFSQTRFILTVEISSIYSHGGKVRRIHNLIFLPSLDSAEKLRNRLISLGCNLDSDGRPIIGLSSEQLADILFQIDEQAAIIPAHAWTPWFSVFGSMSGFDSLEECFGKYADKIFAIETGLSSNPQMNWRLSKLDKVALISNSDSHSLPRIGREANIFECELSYQGIMEALKNSAPEKLQNLKTEESRAKLEATIEFFPEEGKYHYDGHRACEIFLSPEDTKKYKNLCPKCGKPLTIGVLNRVEELADRKIEATRKDNLHFYGNLTPYYSLIQLDEIISEAIGVGPASKKVSSEYQNLIKIFGSEIKILIETDLNDLKKAAHPRIAEGIEKMRKGEIRIRPGYDGEYGAINIFGEEDGESKLLQSSLF